jgi:hypothetical protein
MIARGCSFVPRSLHPSPPGRQTKPACDSVQGKRAIIETRKKRVIIETRKKWKKSDEVRDGGAFSW